MKSFSTLKYKVFLPFAVLLLAVICLTGCKSEIYSGDKPLIVCTIFPEYDWLMNVLGEDADNYDIRLMLDGSTDIHSYQPTAADIAAIASCDLLIYPGGASCNWIEEALKNKTNENMAVLRLVECLGERALSEHDHAPGEGGHEHEHHHAEGEGSEYDEHVWLSLKNAELFVKEIAGAVSVISPGKAELYTANAENYTAKLNELDEAYAQAVASAEFDTVMFADRFAFRYLTEDYGIHHYEAFSGCSADAEAGFDTVVYLAEKLTDEKLPVLVVLENTDKSLAETIIKTSGRTDVEIVVLDSMQSITDGQFEEGYDYLSAMEENLEAVCHILNAKI